jgi:hypothetical protein
MPPGTPTGFPVAQVFSEKGAEFNTPLAEGLMTHLNAALVQQFQAEVQPNGVLNDGHGEAVAVGFRVGHGGSGYPNLIKATQPTELLDRRCVWLMQAHALVSNLTSFHWLPAA